MSMRDGMYTTNTTMKHKHIRQNSITNSSSYQQSGGGVGAAGSRIERSTVSPAQNSITTSSSSSSAAVATEEYAPQFFDEISCIMRGYGDCDKPLKESVCLIDKILVQQLRTILQAVIELAIERKGEPKPTQRDFEFLMRKNPVKVYRLQKHIKDLQAIKKLQDRRDGIQAVHNPTDGYNSDDDGDRDVPEKFDEEKLRRLFRADRISQTLNDEQYKEYIEARRTSFHAEATRKKLRACLKEDTIISGQKDFVISNQVFTILLYLAHETIATIVDFAILTRLTSANRITEPYSRLGEGTSYGMAHLCPEVTQGRGLDGIKPITTQEIHEALRRHSLCTSKTLGMHRNMERTRHIPFLAM